MSGMDRRKLILKQSREVVNFPFVIVIEVMSMSMSTGLSRVKKEGDLTSF